MIRRIAALLTATALLGNFTALSQTGSAAASILIDALVFRGSELAGKENVDIYVTVPYQSLSFNEYDDRYAAQYKATIVIRDKIGRRIVDSTVTRSMLTEDFNVAHGMSGNADNLVVRFPLKPGEYRYEVVIDDLFSQREFEREDTLSVPDLRFTPTISSIMYVSQVEQRGSRFKITPYVGGIVWNNETSLFAFMEVYEDKIPQTVAFSWSVQSSDGKALGSGQTGSIEITKRKSQHFFPLRPIERGLPGDYALIIAMHPVYDGVADTTEKLAERQRPYIVPSTLQGAILADLTLAVKQLVYVADQDQIDLILGASDATERRFRFEEFWKQHDPSPATTRNEAFDEYFRRIAAANLRFKSYAVGWLTDMGHIYIIYGEPTHTERITGQSGQVMGIRWHFSNNVSFLFEDTSNFGDYRLRTPLPPGQKYRYRP